jgi:hypothetical protein
MAGAEAVEMIDTAVHDTILRKRGSLPGWRYTVARLAKKSSVCMLVIAAAFAAPLLRLLKIRPFTILLYGTSLDGKTTIELGAASMIGIGDEPMLPKWSMTEARVSEYIRDYNDLVFPLDDISYIRGPDKTKYEWARDYAYLFSGGGQREISRRASRAFNELPPRPDGYFAIPISSYERSMATLAEDVGQYRYAGEETRLIDLPVKLAGSKSIWDLAGQPPKGIAPAKWDRTLFKRFRDACKRNHGWALHYFMKKVVASPTECQKAVQTSLVYFQTHFDWSPTDKLEQRVIDEFAFIYGSGCSGIDAKILPWTKEELFAAVEKGCRQALSELRQSGRRAQEGLRRLEAVINDAAKVVPVKNRQQVLPKGAIGRTYTVGGKRVVEIIRLELTSMKGLGQYLPGIEFKLGSILRRDSDGKSTVRERWPGRPKRVRCLKLVWPKTLPLHKALSRLSHTK